MVERISTTDGTEILNADAACKALPVYPPNSTRRAGTRRDVARDRDKIYPPVRAEINRVLTGQAPWPLFIYGPVGSGKTCAALCMLDAVEGHGVFYDANELRELVHQASFGDLRDDDGVAARPRKVNVVEVWRGWWLARLAVLDDIGVKSSVSDFALSTIKRAIDHRNGRPLVITSNRTPTQIQEMYDDRVASRCVAGTVVKMPGGDRRVE